MGICQRCPHLILLLLFLGGFANPGVANDPPLAQPGEQPFFASDVVLAIDQSTLALLSSGIDVDGDGVVGRNKRAAAEWVPLANPAQFWTSDSGDTIQALQLRVARALVARLAVRQNRVGLASLTLRARTHGFSLVQHTEKSAVIVPVGEPGAVLAALEDFPAAHQRRRTDLRRLLERAAELLDDATPGTEPGDTPLPCSRSSTPIQAFPVSRRLR